MADYLVEITQTTTTTYAVPADKVADGDEAIQRYAEIGVPIHSESNTTDAEVVGKE